MANPTNINVPPAKMADPTNVNAPVHGTKFPSGVTGADQTIILSQGTDMGINQTNTILVSWIAPFDGYFRKGNYQSVTVTATATFDVYNATQAVNVVSAITAVAGTAAAITFTSTAAQTFNTGDEIQLRATTNGTGALKGASVTLFYTPLSGSTTNPV